MRIIGQAKIKKQLRVAVKENLNTLIVGDTGCGKTSIIKNIAQKKQTVIRFNLTGETTVDDFVGRKGLKNGETVWEDGVLLDCMRNGYWLIVDEINAALPEILFVLHSLMDDFREVLVVNNDNEIVKPHKDFRLFATMNPVDEYAGTKDLNKALKSRFDMIIKMEYPSNANEIKIIKERCKIKEDSVAIAMVETADKIRECKKTDDIFFTLSTRELIQWGKLFNVLDFETAFELSILNKANGDYDKLKEVFESVNTERIKYEEDENRISFSNLISKEDELKEKETELLAKIDEQKNNLRNEIYDEARKEVYDEVANKIKSQL